MRNPLTQLVLLLAVIITLPACQSTLTPEEQRALNREIRDGIGGANCTTTAGSVTQCTKW